VIPFSGIRVDEYGTKCTLQPYWLCCQVGRRERGSNVFDATRGLSLGPRIYLEEVLAVAGGMGRREFTERLSVAASGLARPAEQLSWQPERSRASVGGHPGGGTGPVGWVVPCV